MFFLFILALVCWIFRPSWLMLLWLISIPLLAPILVLRMGIQTTEELLEFLFQIWGVFQRVFIIIVIYQLVIKKKKMPKGISVFLIPCGFLCVYLIFHHVIRHFDAVLLYRDVAGAIYCFLPILVMMLDKEVRPKLNQLFGVLVFIVVVQLFFVPLNLEGIVVYTMRYQDNLFLQEELGLVSGTFSQSNALADFLSVAYLFICVDFFARKGMSNKTFFFVSAVILTLLSLTGSKMPIVCSLMALAMCVFYYKREMILPIVSILVGLTLVIVLSWNNIEKLGEQYRGVDRFVSGMSNFINSTKGKEDNNSTVKLSTALLDKYYLESPFIGCGYAYKGQEKAYPLNLNSDFVLSDYMADATLALHIVEYGIIGIILFLWYYYSLIKYSVILTFRRKGNAVAIIMFYFFLFFSVTEGGLFYRPNFFYFYTYIFAVQRYFEEKKMILDF